MRDPHDPHDAFVDRLEREIAAEVTRRRRSGSVSRPAPWTRWMPQSPVTAGLAAAALVIVSMVIRGGVVAASYQAESNSASRFAEPCSTTRPCCWPTSPLGTWTMLTAA